MPQKQTVKVDVGGEEKTIEVYDAAAVDTLVKDKETAFSTEKTALEKTAKDAADALAKVDKTNKDFEGLRVAKETAEKALTDATTKYTTEITELKSKPLVEHRTNLSTLLAGDDKNIAEKIKFHMEKTVTAMPERTKEEIDAKVKAAYQLAIGTGYKEDFVSRVISSAGGGHVTTKVEVATDLKNMAIKNFGLTEKDFENAKAAGLL